METRALKWWGWGWEDRSRPIEGYPVAWQYLVQRLKIDPHVHRTVPTLDSVRIPPSLLSPDELSELEKLVGEGNVSAEHRDRVVHAVGRGYKDLVRLREGTLLRAPDAVLFPEDGDAIAAVLEFARRRQGAGRDARGDERRARRRVHDRRPARSALPSQAGLRHPRQSHRRRHSLLSRRRTKRVCVPKKLGPDRVSSSLYAGAHIHRPAYLGCA